MLQVLDFTKIGCYFIYRNLSVSPYFEVSILVTTVAKGLFEFIHLVYTVRNIPNKICKTASKFEKRIFKINRRIVRTQYCAQHFFTRRGYTVATFRATLRAIFDERLPRYRFSLKL